MELEVMYCVTSHSLNVEAKMKIPRRAISGQTLNTCMVKKAQSFSFYLTVERVHVHRHRDDQSVAFVQLPFQQLTQHVNTNQLVAVNDRSLG